MPLLPPDSSDDEDEDERHPPTPSTDLTYGDVGLYALGPGGKRLVDIAIVVSQIGKVTERILEFYSVYWVISLGGE